jgi:hypothetical protein
MLYKCRRNPGDKIAMSLWRRTGACRRSFTPPAINRRIGNIAQSPQKPLFRSLAVDRDLGSSVTLIPQVIRAYRTFAYFDLTPLPAAPVAGLCLASPQFQASALPR